MLTYRRVLLFFFLAAFAPEVAAALRWAVSLVYDVGTEPALQGLGLSAIAVAANAALIWGALHLLGNYREARRGAPDSSEPLPDAGREATASDPTVPFDPLGQGGPEPASWPEEGGSDEHHSERA
jgi:hypothetical protein